MRYVSTTVSKHGTKRVMLVENPQDPRFHGGVLCFMYRGTEDGPPESCTFFDGFTVSLVMAELAEISPARDLASWSTIPDQAPGCLDEWVGPVRAVRNAKGVVTLGVWEKLVGGEWVRFSS